MIQLVRVDDRLLHGQVAYSWKAELGYEAIVIVSDSAYEDDVRKMAIKMAKPEGVKLAIRDSNSAIELLNNNLLKDLKVFVVVDNIHTAKKILGNISEKPKLNIGGIQKEEGKQSITKYAFIDNQERQILQELSEKNFDIEFKLVPSDRPKYFKDL